MADNYQLNIGSLRSQVQLTLHTHHAARIWLGRQKTDDKHSILGLAGFCLKINQIDRGAAQDDPYSDWWMIRIEEKIQEVDDALKAIDSRLDEVMAQLPKALEIGENLSIQPLKLPLFISNPLGFKGVHLLTQYDEVVRRILLAQHVAMIGRRDGEIWIDEGAHLLRSLFGLAQLHRFSGASRDDFAANNARAENAREMYKRYGDIPQDILEGTRRSNFAPPIRRGSAGPVEDLDDDLEGEA
ncbi:TIGR03761 family integrating conjugative element protein [Pseudomonas sp. CAH-1]|uniref:Integrating conjugative element protein n=2 Tax=Pseudomonas TaxID=286 RepID=A0A2S3WQ37_PSEPU|nr:MULTISPECIES: TIGR03761 family integrating conjugative element protein [Pseudomonas]ERT15316.1 conjugal transfer protein [Pseudomonas putida SJ3]MBH3373744.1 TIGR03761 family integrating conjugative element protein [Pseudomonas juntendi]MBI6918148.1 TIGR03761 family integrating conjugative element protein [Pseudomonas monteilii]MBS6036829.1 TIGR03761 family integrating conjugative element protein [Pseudomonas sp.]MCE0938103.1 TIGR03761 family integrating conjugative element protein [Pseudom